MLVLNPNLARSGDLLEVENIYKYGDILRTGMLLHILDVVIFFSKFFSKDRFIKLLLDSGANQDSNSPDGCCKLLFALKYLRFGAYRTAGYRLKFNTQTFNLIQHLVIGSKCRSKSARSSYNHTASGCSFWWQLHCETSAWGWGECHCCGWWYRQSSSGQSSEIRPI